MAIFKFEKTRDENRLRVTYGALTFNLWCTKIQPIGRYHFEKSKEIYLEPALYRQLTKEATEYLISA